VGYECFTTVRGDIMNNRFRPLGISKQYLLTQRRLTGRIESYSRQSRIEWYPAGWQLNHRTIGRQFSKLHYLACHAPAPIVAKWRPVYNVFYKKYFGSNRASNRFLNKHTAYSWL